MQKSDLDSLSSRPLRAIHADGITELVMGLTWLLWGILLGYPQLLPPGSLWKPYWMIVPLVLVCSGFLGQWTTKKLKERWIYRRAGYVQPSPPSHGRLWSTLLIAAVTAAVTAAFLSRSGGWRDMLPLGISVMVAGALAFGLGRQGVPGAAFYGIVSVGLGIAIMRQRADIELGFALLWTGLGVSMTIGGGWRLFNFVRTHPEVQLNG